MIHSEHSPCILAVIVLYREVPEGSVAFRTLQKAAAELGDLQERVRVLLYDNEPVASASFDLPGSVSYVAAKENAGIAAAYNYALRLIEQQDNMWILTLDQDAEIPSDFLVKMYGILGRVHVEDGIGAVVPHLFQEKKLLSPVRLNLWGVTHLPLESAGVVKGEIHAFNSGSLFRADALRQIGGFDLRFWLDYQDASIYRRLYQCGKKVYVAGDLKIKHDLSLISGGSSIGVRRFRNFITAESAYHDLYRGRIARSILTWRLLVRFLRQWANGFDPAVCQLTRKEFMRRLLRSRRRRIEDWRIETRIYLKSESAAGDAVQKGKDRPKVSVCMATFNGQKYIAAQLQSILGQLAPTDEVIVVDDASMDETKERVLAFGDARVRLIEHARNLGVARTFEDSIRAASGEVLFLSDQDDIWDPRKVAMILATFQSHPDVTLIATDNAVIDENGSLIAGSYFSKRGRFHPGLWANILRNRFGGCTMAFRAEVIYEVLPLPHGYDVLHDIWIGVRNSLSGHRALYLPEALVLNRRHSTTVTGRKALTLSRKVRIRVHLLVALAEFQLRKIVF